jgi:hypothetical protein
MNICAAMLSCRAVGQLTLAVMIGPLSALATPALADKSPTDISTLSTLGGNSKNRPYEDVEDPPERKAICEQLRETVSSAYFTREAAIPALQRMQAEGCGLAGLPSGEKLREQVESFEKLPTLIPSPSPDPAASPPPTAPGTTITVAPLPPGFAGLGQVGPLPPSSDVTRTPAPLPPSGDVTTRAPASPASPSPAASPVASPCDVLRQSYLDQLAAIRGVITRVATADADMPDNERRRLNAWLPDAGERLRASYRAMHALGCPDIPPWPTNYPPAGPTPARQLPPADELDGFPEDIRDDLRRLKRTDPEAYQERIRRLRPQVPVPSSTPSSTTTTLEPLTPPAIAGLGGIEIPPTGNRPPPVLLPPVANTPPPGPPSPLPPVALNTPSSVTPPPPPATPASVPSTPGPQLKKITTICQQGPEAKEDATNTPYKCRKVDKVCEPGTKGPNCPPWMHTTDTVVCTSWRTRPEQGDVATCLPMNCNIPANNVLPERVGSACGHAVDPSYTGLKSAVLPPATLPPPKLSSAPYNVQPKPKKQVDKKKKQPKTYRGEPAAPRHDPNQAARDAATATAVIGIIGGIAGGAIRSRSSGGGHYRQPGPTPRSGGHH